MHSFQSRWNRIVAWTALGILCLIIRPNAAPLASSGPLARMLQLPSRTFWAWERAEDLHAVDPQTTAIAYLDQTILLGRDAVSTPRRQPLTYPSNATLIAVVRIEAPPSASLDA